MNGSGVPCNGVLWNEGTKGLIDVLRQERRIRRLRHEPSALHSKPQKACLLGAHHCSAKCEECLEQGIQCGDRVLLPVFTLQAFPVESNVPIREFVYKVQQPWYNSVQSVRRHLLSDQFDERLAPRKDPPIHDIVGYGCTSIILEFMTSRFLEQRGVAQKEAEGIKPWKKHSRYNLAYSLFPEAKIIASDNGRIDEEHSDSVEARRHIRMSLSSVTQYAPNSICPVRIDDQVGIGIIAQTFAHLFPVTVS